MLSGRILSKTHWFFFDRYWSHIKELFKRIVILCRCPFCPQLPKHGNSECWDMERCFEDIPICLKYTYIYIHVYMYISYTYILVYVYIYIYIQIHCIYIHVYIYVYIYITETPGAGALAPRGYRHPGPGRSKSARWFYSHTSIPRFVSFSWISLALL